MTMDLMGAVFVLQQGSMQPGGNDQWLDGTIVKLTDVFTAEHKNRSMHYLFHRNCGYAYAVVVSYANWI